MDIRRRIPFRLNQVSDEDTAILDEQEQEELIEKLHDENTKSNKQSMLTMQILVLLSAILHLVYIINPTDDNTFPFPRPFTFLSLLLHVNLLFLLDSTSVRSFLCRMRIELDSNTDLGLYALSPMLSYTLALVAPTLCLFLGCSWWSIAWWSSTLIITYAVQSVLESIAKGDEHLRSLEAMKYTAPGA